MYYHVYIELKEKDSNGYFTKLYELDINSWEELITDIVKPYFSNQEFLFSGIYIEKNKINRILIKNSSNTIKQIIKIMKDKTKNSFNKFSPITKRKVLLNNEYCEDITKKVFQEIEKITTKDDTRIEENTPLDKSKIFIVHGHDDLAKIEVARFIEKLGFEAIILQEQTSSGKTIIEKIEEYSNVGFGIVLYTPCDIGAKKDENPNYKDRARQNVVFEHGFLIGKIGRNNVCALVKDDVEKPTDISGIVYISMKSHWQIELAKEMKKSGYNIDVNKII